MYIGSMYCVPVWIVGSMDCRPVCIVGSMDCRPVCIVYQYVLSTSMYCRPVCNISKYHITYFLIRSWFDTLFIIWFKYFELKQFMICASNQSLKQFLIRTQSTNHEASHMSNCAYGKGSFLKNWGWMPCIIRIFGRVSIILGNWWRVLCKPMFLEWIQARWNA